MDPTAPHEAPAHTLTLRTAAMLLASGIDPKKSNLFIQSHVSAHTELMWILSCMTPLSWINTMPQYKQKKKDGALPNLGLYAYPVLMASDIILYNASLVPVGEDQAIHLELARDLAERLNTTCGVGTCIVPAAYKAPYFIANRVMDLQNAKAKMSKSGPRHKAPIYLDDSEEIIKDKILKAKTDSISKIYYNEKERPEVANLIEIFTGLKGININDTEKQASELNMYQFKLKVIEELLAV